MLNWNDYDMKCEQYADMRRAADKWRERRAERAQWHKGSAKRQRRVMMWAWFGRRLGRTLVRWGTRLETRYGN